jgi:hypothetical protein
LGFYAFQGKAYLTDFTAAENPISEGGIWTNGAAIGSDWNNVESTAGKAFGSTTVTGYDDCIAHLKSSVIAFPRRQFARGKVYRAGGYSPGVNHEIELLLMFDITNGNARGYEVLWGHAGNGAVVRWNGALNDYTPLDDALDFGVPAHGDELMASIDELGVIRVYKNGTLIRTAPADTTFTSGQPGMGFWPNTGATPANYGWRAFEAGSL